jgi:hypothetical protein
VFDPSLQMPVATVLLHDPGSTRERSSQEAADPFQKLALLLPLKVAEPTCWSLKVAKATEVVAPAGLRSTQDEADGLVHNAARGLPLNVADPTTSKLKTLASIPWATELTAPEGLRSFQIGTDEMVHEPAC